MITAFLNHMVPDHALNLTELAEVDSKACRGRFFLYGKPLGEFASDTQLILQEKHSDNSSQ